MRNFLFGVFATMLAAFLIAGLDAQSRVNVVALDQNSLNQITSQLKLIVAADSMLLRPLRVTMATPPTYQDPCYGPTKGNAAISQTASTKLVSGVPGQRIEICAARVVAAAREIVSFVEGTGSACATSKVAISGSTTTANGESYAANGGFQSNAPIATMISNVPGNDLCLQQNGSSRVSGNIVYAFVNP